jgi:hypothetical protein
MDSDESMFCDPGYEADSTPGLSQASIRDAIAPKTPLR